MLDVESLEVGDDGAYCWSLIPSLSFFFRFAVFSDFRLELSSERLFTQLYVRSVCFEQNCDLISPHPEKRSFIDRLGPYDP